MTQLVGPDEVADMLSVQRNTIAQWRKRGVLLDPFLTISSMPIWRREDVIEWAKRTGREVV